MSRNRDFSSRSAGKMTGVAEAKSALCLVPRCHSDTRATWLSKAARVYGLTLSQARRLYYGEAKRIDSDRLDHIRTVRDQLQESAITRREILNDIAIGIASIRNDARGG